MDPYLEGSEWTSVHTELSSEIARQLSPRLRPKYVARTVRRFLADADIYPDVSVQEATHPDALHESAPTWNAPPLQLATVISPWEPQVTIEIRDVARRELVTAIEVLSPSNKRGEGFQEYVDKRSRVLHSSAHLLEIDLLRRGSRVPMAAPLPAASYFVILSRVVRRPIVEVWPVQLQAVLPVVPVPLAAGDPDVSLDLQAALNTVYDALNYDLSVDYTRPLEVPLSAAEAEWAAGRLRAASQVNT
jgi:Protein of unknown function (DUF4058)